MNHTTRLLCILFANSLLRVATTASSTSGLISFYLVALANRGYSMDENVIGILNVGFEMTALLWAIPAGVLIDRFSPRLVLVVGTIIGGVATQLFGLTTLLSMFMLSRILEGISSASTTPSTLAELTGLTESHPEDRGRVMSWFEISIFAGVALGILISGQLWDSYFENSFALMFLCYLVAAVVFYFAASPNTSAKVAKEQKISLLDSLMESIRHPLLSKLALPWLFFNSITGMWLAHFNFQLIGDKVAGQWLVGRFVEKEFALLAFLYTVFFAAGILVGGILVGRISRVLMMRVAFIAVLGICLSFYLLNASAEWDSTLRLFPIALLIIAIFFQGWFPPAILSFLADVAGEKKGRGATMGFYTFLLSLGNISGSLLGARFALSFAVNGLLIIGAILAILGFFVLLRTNESMESAEFLIKSTKLKQK